MNRFYFLGVVLFLFAAGGCNSTPASGLPDYPACHDAIIRLYAIDGFEVMGWERDRNDREYSIPVDLSFEGSQSLTLKSLEPLGKLRRVQRIGFIRSNLDDSMVDAIMHCRDLEFLQIDETLVSDVFILRLIEHESLNSVYAQGLNISYEVQLEVERKRPDILWLF